MLGALIGGGRRGVGRWHRLRFGEHRRAAVSRRRSRYHREAAAT